MLKPFDRTWNYFGRLLHVCHISICIMFDYSIVSFKVILEQQFEIFHTCTLFQVCFNFQLFVVDKISRLVNTFFFSVFTLSIWSSRIWVKLVGMKLSFLISRKFKNLFFTADIEFSVRGIVTKLVFTLEYSLKANFLIYFFGFQHTSIQ